MLSLFGDIFRLKNRNGWVYKTGACVYRPGKCNPFFYQSIDVRCMDIWISQRMNRIIALLIRTKTKQYLPVSDSSLHLLYQKP